VLMIAIAIGVDHECDCGCNCECQHAAGGGSDRFAKLSLHCPTDVALRKRRSRSEGKDFRPLLRVTFVEKPVPGEEWIDA
jgi:hypothetical protein